MRARRRGAAGAWAAACVVAGWLWLLAAPLPAAAQGAELALLQTQRADGALTLDFATRLTLPRAVDDALQRGVPLYFVAEAQVMRNRWYWRDERVARVARSWRVAYQPLTGTWRVGLGPLNQTFATQAEALAVASRSSGWRIAELSQLDPDKSHYLVFTWRLDTSQLPGPMQFGLGAGDDWSSVSVRQVLRLEP